MPSGKLRWRASRELQDRARLLRREMPPAEQKLWARLRFKRVDGDTHADQVEYDDGRTAWLNAQKQHRVIRFSNREARRLIGAIIEKTREALKG